nr:MAG TPA: hypothetical protein [Caudoviricetes sp.]
MVDDTQMTRHFKNNLKKLKKHLTFDLQKCII